MDKQLLIFKESFYATEPNRKTKLFFVHSAHSNDFLGTIHWRNGWRCYVMSYENNIDMSLSCEKELCEFLEKLEKERKQSSSKEEKGREK